MATGSNLLVNYKTERLDSPDWRNVSPEPLKIDRGMRLQFMTAAASGISTDGSYVGIMKWRSYSSGTDLSGGPVKEIAYGNSRLFHRQSSSTTAWSAWRTLVDIAYNTAVGSSVIPVYVNSSGQVTQCSYSLNASTNAGTTNYVAYYSGTNTIAAAKSTTSMIMPAHYYHNLYNDNPTTGTTVYVHYYNSSTTSTNTYANLRVKADTSYKTLIFGGDGNLTWPGHIKATAGYLVSTANSNTLTIGSLNTSFTHIYNSANIPFIFNNTVETTTGNLGSTSYPWNNLYIGKANGAGIYYVGTLATYRMIRFIDNTGDNYGNGISIGGGGLTVLGSGESADTLLSSLSLTASGGTENTYIGADGSIFFYPGNNSYDASALITMTASRLWVGVNGNTTRENLIGVQGGAGLLYMWCHAAADGSRGIWAPAHGDGSARAVFSVTTTNRVYFADSYNGTSTALAYSLSGLAASAITWLTCWNGYELRAISKAEMANAVDSSHKWVRVAGDTMTGALNFANNVQNKMGDDAYIGDQNVAGHIVIGGLNGASGIRLAAYSSNVAASLIANHSDGVTIRTESGNTWLYIGRDDASATKGIYFPGYGGGWYMQDTTYLRNYNSKHLYITGRLGVDCELRLWGNTRQITRASRSVTWINGRDSALMREDDASGYHGVVMTKTVNGAWTIGNYNASGWYNYLLFSYTTDSNYSAGTNSATTIRMRDSGVVESAMWNDYAEYRRADSVAAGRVVIETGNDDLTICNERLAAGGRVISDTYGFAIGQNKESQTPIAVSGRVLVYPYGDRNKFKPGDAVCTAPNGTIDIMTRDEIMQYPERIIGTVSAVPTYDVWYGGGNYNEDGDLIPIPVNGRIWIYVR